MLLLEHEGKEAFRHYGIPVPPSHLAKDPTEAQPLPLPVMVKAQVHSGGRGKAGLVARADTAEEVCAILARYLDTRFKGERVRSVLIEPVIAAPKEFYLSFLIDRSSRGPMLLASPHGGIDIEENDVDNLLRVPLDLTRGPQAKDAELLRAAYGLPNSSVPALLELIERSWRCFVELRCELLEINPLAMTRESGLVALDAKVVLDDHDVPPAWLRVAAHEQEHNAVAEEASRLRVFPVTMDGKIMVVAGGAGTLMASMDYIASLGGTLAGAIDLGGFALRDPSVLADVVRLTGAFRPAVLFFNSSYLNVARGDDVAKAVADAAIPLYGRDRLVVRLAGNRWQEGHAELKRNGLRATTSLAEACEWAVGAAN